MVITESILSVQSHPTIFSLSLMNQHFIHQKYLFNFKLCNGFLLLIENHQEVGDEVQSDFLLLLNRTAGQEETSHVFLLCK